MKTAAVERITVKAKFKQVTTLDTNEPFALFK
jgi:hypothetical protein